MRAFSARSFCTRLHAPRRVMARSLKLVSICRSMQAAYRDAPPALVHRQQSYRAASPSLRADHSPATCRPGSVVRWKRSVARSVSGTTQPSPGVQVPPAPSWDIKMLYDGDCPLCMREVNMLKRRDVGKNRIFFVDIAAPDYSPSDNAGISFEEAMGTIHGILPGGKVITNVEVFRRLYEAVGLGWVYAITKFGPISRIANAVYGVWAKYRLPITGRPDLEVILDKRKSCR